jgi:hypothetical protein
MIIGVSEVSEVSYMSGKHTQWLDYLPCPALIVCASSRFCAVGLVDGSVIVYSHTGRRYVIALQPSRGANRIARQDNAEPEFRRTVFIHRRAQSHTAHPYIDWATTFLVRTVYST